MYAKRNHFLKTKHSRKYQIIYRRRLINNGTNNGISGKRIHERISPNEAKENWISIGKRKESKWLCEHDVES